MSVSSELRTVNSTMSELAQRITALVEGAGDDMPADVYSELVAAERTVGALRRRLERVGSRLERTLP